MCSTDYQGNIDSDIARPSRIASRVIVAIFLLILGLTIPGSSQDLCTNSSFNATPGSQQIQLNAEDRIAVWISPTECSCSYPHRVSSVAFSLSGDGAQWPVTVDVVVYTRIAGNLHECARSRL